MKSLSFRHRLGAMIPSKKKHQSVYVITSGGRVLAVVGSAGFSLEAARHAVGRSGKAPTERERHDFSTGKCDTIIYRDAEDQELCVTRWQVMRKTARGPTSGDDA